MGSLENKAILHIVCTFPPYNSGMGFSALEQAKLGQKMGYKITVITPNYQKKQDNIETIEGITVIKKHPIFAFGKSAIINTFKHISKNDIIHIHYPFFLTTLFSVLYAKIKHKKIILYWHMNPENKGLIGLIFKSHEKIILPIILKISNKVLVSTFDYFANGSSKKIFKKFKKKIFELPFAVDTKRFIPRDKKIELLKKYELNNRKILLFVGGLDRNHYFKGVDVLLKAFSKLKKEYKLIIIGNGDLEEYYKNLTKNLQIDSDVIFLHNINNDDLPYYYNLSDVLILPSINKGEAFGIVQIEAMASGIPVIVSNLPGVRAVLKDENTGFVFKTKDSEDLKLKIEKLFEDLEKYNTMKQNARKRSLEHFSKEIISNKLEEFYRNLF